MCIESNLSKKLTLSSKWIKYAWVWSVVSYVWKIMSTSGWTDILITHTHTHTHFRTFLFLFSVYPVNMQCNYYYYYYFFFSFQSIVLVPNIFSLDVVRQILAGCFEAQKWNKPTGKILCVQESWIVWRKSLSMRRSSSRHYSNKLKYQGIQLYMLCIVIWWWAKRNI